MPDPMALLAHDAIADRPFAPIFAGRSRPLLAHRAWVARLSRWLRARADALDPAGSDARAFDDFAGLLSRAREADEVRVALVRLAGRMSGAARVELVRARSGHNAHPLASWPDRPVPSSASPSWTEHRGKPGLPGFRTRHDRPESSPLRLDLRAGDDVLATLILTAADDRPWTSEVARRLETLCTMAALAERGLATTRRNAGEEAVDPEGIPSGEPTLAAFLKFALAQARRRHEPLSLLSIEVDRLAAIRSLLGEQIADAAVTRVASAIRETLRASDVVARLDGGRLSVILPTASAADAARVAEGIRAVIARVGVATESMPTLTATIGVASYPDHGREVATLRAAAASALSRAKCEGFDRVAAA
jgi:diguanylate cyclase (GGDEF)-like protein